MEDKNHSNPFSDESEIANWIYNLLPRYFNNFSFSGNPGPSVDLLETDKELILHADLPGMNQDDLDVTVNQNLIILKGFIRKEPFGGKKKYYINERRTDGFYRAIPLPVEVNSRQAVAKYRNGVLEVKIPKAENPMRKKYKPQIEFEDKHSQMSIKPS